jgi:hypothetical protein
MRRIGIDVLDHGLPALPQTLTHQMAIPLAYWTAGQNAVVLFLQFDRAGNEWDPFAVMATFTREHGQWTAASGHWLVFTVSYVQRNSIPAPDSAVSAARRLAGGLSS